MTMASPRVIWNGTPGEVWHNATEKIKYQLICEFNNSCGVCIQYHLAISNWWPIPFHRNCRCRQIPIRPGGAAQPFRDFRAILDELSPGQRREAIGASNYKLLDAGLIKWEDVVTPTRVRDLQEVVALRKLTVDQMTGAGVKPRYADEAYARVHTPQAELIRETRQKLITKVQDAGISREQLVKHAQEAIGQKVGIGGGPSKTQRLTEPGKPQPPLQPPPQVAVQPKLPPEIVRDLKRFAEPKVPIPKPPVTPTPSVAPTPKPQPLTFTEALEAKLRDLPPGTDAAGRKARRAAIRDLLTERSTEDAIGQKLHGMTTTEKFRSVSYQGIRFHFTDPVSLISELENLDRQFASIPRRLVESTHDVYYTAQKNSDDDMWRKLYDNFAESKATGGSGEIVVYGGNLLGVGSLTHEMGHNLAEKLYGVTDPYGDYRAVIKAGTESPVSAYAKNSSAEDFAESARVYSLDRAEFEKSHPERYKVIHRIMMDKSYGG